LVVTVTLHCFLYSSSRRGNMAAHVKNSHHPLYPYASDGVMQVFFYGHPACTASKAVFLPTHPPSPYCLRRRRERIPARWTRPGAGRVTSNLHCSVHGKPRAVLADHPHACCVPKLESDPAASQGTLRNATVSPTLPSNI
jgi:hypothetical protein